MCYPGTSIYLRSSQQQFVERDSILIAFLVNSGFLLCAPCPMLYAFRNPQSTLSNLKNLVLHFYILLPYFLQEKIQGQIPGVFRYGNQDNIISVFYGLDKAISLQGNGTNDLIFC